VLKVGKFALCVLFPAALAVACYRHPVPDDRDRYISASNFRSYKVGLAFHRKRQVEDAGYVPVAEAFDRIGQLRR